jgi:hypothetical protein
MVESPTIPSAVQSPTTDNNNQSNNRNNESILVEEQSVIQQPVAQGLPGVLGHQRRYSDGDLTPTAVDVTTTNNNSDKLLE